MKLTETEFREFIETHANADTAKLRMKYRGDDRGYLQAIEQIELRRKSPEKFVDSNGDSMRPEILYSALAVEQSTSATVARYHSSLVAAGSSILDMTMGMGMDAIAFATIAGCDVTAIERNDGLYAASLKNYASIPNLEMINADSVAWLAATDRCFDAIFIDPARRDIAGNRVYNIHDCTPDVAEIMPLMLSHAPRIIIKLSPMLDVTATMRDIPLTASIHIVEDRGECRELLAIVERDCDVEPDIKIVNGEPKFSFRPSEESAATARFGIPQKGDFLYEPSTATMKAGPFRLLCERFGTMAVAPNSHLYFSSNQAISFPGKEYVVEEVLPYSSGTLKRFSRQWPSASVAVRNFPESADRLRARLKVKESDTLRLMATTAVGGEKLLLLLKHSGH